MAKKRSQKMLEQLAYGNVNDALKMLVEINQERPNPDVLDKLDLRNVCSVRYTSAGGFELQFYDRFRAIQELEALGSTAQPFYRALEDCVVKSFGTEDEVGDCVDMPDYTGF